MRSLAVSLAVACSIIFIAAAPVAPAHANDITKEWSTVKPPPVPVLKPATIDPKTTALLVLDFMKVNCGVRPRCASTVPVANKLIAAARAHNMLLFFTLVGPTPKPDAMVDGITRPHEGEWMPRGGADKFVGSDLGERLKAHGIKTVLVIGTSAQGAVLGTSNGAAQRGYKVVVPVDGMSSETPYNEQYAAWHLYKGGPGPMVKKVTLTRSDMITFGK